MIKLDESRQYGTISGNFADEPTARYYQDGKFFNAQKELINGGLRQNEESSQDDGRSNDERHGHDQTDGQGNAQTGSEKTDDDAGQNEEGHVLENPDSEDSNEPGSEGGNSGELIMDKTDDELAKMASEGIAPLRDYAIKFGIKGTSKKEIVSELVALRK